MYSASFAIPRPLPYPRRSRDRPARDHPEKHNLASALKCFRLVKKDRKMPDPYTIYEAEALIIATGAKRRATTTSSNSSRAAAVRADCAPCRRLRPEDHARRLCGLDRRLEGVGPRSNPANDGVEPARKGADRERQRGRRHGRGVGAVALTSLSRRTVCEPRKPSTRDRSPSAPRIWHRYGAGLTPNRGN